MTPTSCNSVLFREPKVYEEGKTTMNEGLIITLLIVNIALSGAALLGVFVVLGMVRGRED